MKETPISTFGEFGLIEHLTKNIELNHASTIVGVGDDAAIIDHYGKQTVFSSDMLVEGIHFDMMYTPLKHLGYKSVVVNLSDIYAMGATPTQLTIALSISSKYTLEALTEFYDGVYQACAYYNVDLVGGDTCSSTQGLVIAITAIGESVPNKFYQRHTANEGDLICVSGDLGAAYVGLVVLEREKKIVEQHPTVQPELKKDEYVIGRLLKPEARADIIDWLNENDVTPTSMIDVSDGLSSDLLHICTKSEVGCVLFEQQLPISEQTRNSAFRLTLDPTMCVLHGGEDYELLFTIHPDAHNKIKTNSEISIIGIITDMDSGTKLTTKSNNTYPLSAQGWNSFRQDSSD